ncbi:MAG: RtcB family protein [Candidatus Nealsonbacteria bacterium]|nr:RtcB family protein [Candidatus Nealsonbacteria bacterium]
MVSQKDFHKINDWLWELPQDFRADMRVPVRVYVSEEMLAEAFKDNSLFQAMNVATLPGIQKYALVMPDMHEGYASPIGGVAAIETAEGIVSPGMCGYDINCGVRLLRSAQNENSLRPYLDKLAVEIQKRVPSGLGQGRQIKLSNKEIDGILEEGVKSLVSKGYANPEDEESCEASGRLPWADSRMVSRRARDRGRDQVGTLGSGNHFLEVQKVAEIFDETIAQGFGLFKDQVVLMVHCGSRGLGHQVCTDYLKEFIPLMEGKYKIQVSDREFAGVPFASPEGQRYFSAMAAAANFAWANRQMITFFVRQAWQNVLGEKGGRLDLLYDVAHNIIKKEKYPIEGREVEVAVHRKGATRAFPPGSPEIPEKYRPLGQPVLIPGSMGTASYVLVGTPGGEASFFSAAHGAGRAMSRHQALRTVSGPAVVRQLQQQGIIVRCESVQGIAEEAPIAYKDIESIVEVVQQANLARRVARLKPLAVIKGE